MITPNKVITLRESALGRAPIILRQKAPQADIVSLYGMVNKDFESVDQFLLTLDVLYILGQINVELSSGLVTYAD